MQIVRSVAEMQTTRRNLDRQSVGFVPTMGYLHAGHLSLVNRARKENSSCIVSIFVNPTQFGPNEDFSRYPRDEEHDLKMLEDAKVDIVFIPTVEDMYPAGFSNYIESGDALIGVWEGAIRPGHFRGVTTVVGKLFNIVQPDYVYFGQKDAQQVAVIKRMVQDLNFDVSLRIGSIIREPDGLAMSSRNSYLNVGERQKATILFRSLQMAKALTEDSSNTRIISEKVKSIFDDEGIQLDYIAIVDPDTLKERETLAAPTLFAVAARVGKTRLIDNFLWRSDGSWDVGVKRGE